MLRRSNQVDDYFKMKIESSSPMGLIYMVYERAIQSLEEAERGFNLNNRKHYTHYVIHAQDCIRELRNSLDLKIGGNFASSLYSIYEFMISHLIEANLDRKAPLERLRRIKKMLIELHQTWKQAEKKLNDEKLKKQPKEYQSFSISG